MKLVDLSDEERSEIVSEVVEVLADGDVDGQLKQVELLREASNERFLLKIADRLGLDREGALDKEKREAALSNLAEGVAGSLNHEMDHIVDIDKAYEKVVEELKRLLACFREARAANN